MKEKIEAWVQAWNAPAKEKYRAWLAIAPLILALEEQEAAKKYDIPDDAWLLIPEELRHMMLQTVGALFLEAAAK